MDATEQINPADAWVRTWSEGEACFALWQQNLWCQAVIVDKRPAEGVPSLLGLNPPAPDTVPHIIAMPPEAQQHEFKFDANGRPLPPTSNQKKRLQSLRRWEYYVHFSDFNRRLDRWVHADDIKVAVNPNFELVLGVNVVATPQGYRTMWGGGLSTSATAIAEATGMSHMSMDIHSTSGAKGVTSATISSEVATSPIHPLASALSSSSTTGGPPAGWVFAGSPAANAAAAASWSPVSSSAGGIAYSDMSAYSLASGSKLSGPVRLPRAALRRERTRGIVSDTNPLDAADIALEKEHEERTKVKNIDIVQFGKYEIDAWYYSPYPDEYKQCHRLFVCEFCLKYMRSARLYVDHISKCIPRHPPGLEIYRKDKISIWEIDGGQQRLYCQCLCLLSKLFIDHKTLYYDVEPFYFYVMTETDEEGSHIVGYFSKEKASTENYNVACILTFPQHQRKGYGRFLIDFSYALTKLEGGVGSPEKPLSDLGKLSYRAYWTQTLLKTMASIPPKDWTVAKLSQLTAITQEDVAGALHSLNLLQYARGQHYVDASPKIVDALIAVHCKSKELELVPSLIQWEPHPQHNSRKRVRRTTTQDSAAVGSTSPSASISISQKGR